jgi:hypothetical protein
MSGIEAVGGGATLSTSQISAEYQIRAAKLQKDAVDLAGHLAVQLIESARLDPEVGVNLNVQG